MSLFNNRDIVQILRSFDRNEVKGFKSYIVFMGGKSELLLWEAIHSLHPKYNITDIAAFKKIRPGQSYNDDIFRSCVSNLAKRAKEFLTWQEFKKNELLYNNTMNLTLLKRRLVKQVKKGMTKQKKALEKVKRTDTQYYVQCHDFQDIGYQFVTRFDHRASTNSLQKASDYLDYSYIVQKLRYLFAMYNRRRIVSEKQEYVFRMEKELLGYLAENPQQHLPILHMYYLMLRMIQDLDNHVSFYQFLDYYKENRRQITLDEARHLITGAINFCLWNIRLGRLEFLTPRWDLSTLMVTEGLFIVGGKVPEYQFQNTVRNAIQAGELDWAAAFIYEWLPKTPKEHRKELEAFSHAYHQFAKGDYDKQAVWMDIMGAPKFAFNSVNTEISFRILKLKTAYKNLEPTPKPIVNEAFHAKLDAFRNYLSCKNTIPKRAKGAANNFQKALNQLHRKKIGKTLKVGALKTYILGLRPIRELPWLLGEVQRLEV